MISDDAPIWTIIVLLGIGTYAIRFSFLALLGDRTLPPWLLRLLRYTPVAVLPGIVAPLVLSPPATDGVFDPARFAAAVAALAIGIVTRSFLTAIAGGAATLYLALWLLN
ncbi:branched-subunit amino acid transport protein [Palleronia aestuarii]|uniref:Branched-subunit amino acid transport protein n=1 Tax=Palleronia aestuarii TaxID=568105 RepID=A0A2W7P846_9RHOB|nr:AzlD domain-containing protein [Palleronia aestuarii]PZX19572.1 branched-subunit amino acid transport protein [Palleronia aestuarii]